MKFKILTLIAFLLLALVSCKTTRPAIIEVPVQYKERIVERLVPVELPADSANVFALLECDSTKQVILKELSEEKSKRIQSLFSFDSGLLKYKAKTIHDTVYLPAKDSIIYKEIPIRVEIPIEINRLTKWQKFQMNAGRLFFLIIILYVIYTVFKWKNRILK
jgi:hypothetical protein